MLMNFCFTQPTKSVHIAKVIINEKTLVIFSWKLKTGLDLHEDAAWNAEQSTQRKYHERRHC